MNISNRTIYCKDNLDILQNIDSESVDMIYLDPPFNKNQSFTAPIGSSAKGASFKDIFAKEDYKDEWKDEFKIEYEELYNFLESMPFYANESDVAYIAYMAIRIIECHRILKDDGCLFYHCDDTMQHYIKIMLDIIFGRENFINELNWQRYQSHSLKKKGFDRVTDAILYYQKTDDFESNTLYIKKDEYLKKHFRYIEEQSGRRFQHIALEKSSNYKYDGEERIVNGEVYKTNVGWIWSQKTFDERLKENPYVIYKTKNGKLRQKMYEDEWKGKPMIDVWNDIPTTKMTKREKKGYPTQKPLVLLERLIMNSTNEGDFILDPFCGCATALVAAEKLNREWVGIDISIKAFELVKERLKEEVEGFNEDDRQFDVFGSNKPIHFTTDAPTLSKYNVKPKKYIYVISNPNHKGYKVGIAKNVKQRLNAYQTSDPNRAFKLEFSIKTENYRSIESEVHNFFNANYEWVDAELKDIIRKIKSLVKETL
ncbi:DNA methyltransferase [Flavobacteriaceae bacterium]|nr:DNA methyltransferase [Flavobacteriaceae bacterium]